MAIFHLFILSIFVLIIQINGYPNGAPKKACTSSMLPKHHHYTPQPPSTSPLTKFSSTWNPDGETILVQIESKEPIKGIFLQGRLMNGIEPLGTFVNIPSETHLVDCPSGDGVTHNAPQRWTQLQLTWKKPESVKSGDTIQFWATVVVNFQNFWVVKSIE